MKGRKNAPLKHTRWSEPLLVAHTTLLEISCCRSLLLAILVIDRRKNPVLEFEREFDKSNPYMKFGRIPIKNDQVRMTTDGQQ